MNLYRAAFVEFNNFGMVVFTSCNYGTPFKL